MKHILSIFLLSVLVACNTGTQQAKPETTDNPADKLNVPVEDIIGTARKVDIGKNPYLTDFDNSPLTACSDTNQQSLFKCITGQFGKASPPLELGPLPEPEGKTSLSDSLFIVKCLNDGTFYNEDPGDRTYGYHKGIVLDETSNYTLCLIMFGFSVGFEYHLYSFSPEGTFISKEIVGGYSGDVEEYYCNMPDTKNFEVYKNEFDYKDDRPVISKTTHTRFLIDDMGKFVKQ